MTRIILGAFVYTATLMLLGEHVDGVYVSTFWPTAVLAGIGVSIVINILVPIARAILIPIELITFGLYSFILRVLSAPLVAVFLLGFNISGLSAGIITGFVIALLSILLQHDEND